VRSAPVNHASGSIGLYGCRTRRAADDATRAADPTACLDSKVDRCEPAFGFPLSGGGLRGKVWGLYSATPCWLRPTPPAASRATACAPTRCRSHSSAECRAAFVVPGDVEIAAGEGEAVPGFDRISLRLPLRQRLFGRDGGFHAPRGCRALFAQPGAVLHPGDQLLTPPGIPLTGPLSALYPFSAGTPLNRCSRHPRSNKEG
jgi:hypothetical protein